MPVTFNSFGSIFIVVPHVCYWPTAAEVLTAVRGLPRLPFQLPHVNNAISPHSGQTARFA
jgi:hypothetical protein